jgi:hypothetical protein
MTDAAPKRIWADQENLTWVEVYPGEAMMDYEAEYILASEHAALIREAEARGMERAAGILDIYETIDDESAAMGVRWQVDLPSQIAAAIRAAKATP